MSKLKLLYGKYFKADYHRIFRVFILIMMLAFLGNNARASVSGFTSYSYSATNPLQIVIPANLISVSISISVNISGTATVTDPDGKVVSTVGIFGGTVNLEKIGTYTVSESYHMELTGTPPQIYGSPTTVTDNAASIWQFNNSIPGAIGNFKVTNGYSLSIMQKSDNVSIGLSDTSATVTNTKDIGVGGTASATLGCSWGVNTSISITERQFGSISVTTNLDSAVFQMSGPESYTGNGKSFSVAEAPVGEYTITYGDVDGYNTPASETKTLTKDAAITFSGKYELLPQYGSI
ncbi:hypothetical protein GF312_06395, partial [Candidatus Poribacteria bacterium]|nr:hypothetical protein [Candidatus Poribacteria bacterium]